MILSGFIYQRGKIKLARILFLVFLAIPLIEIAIFIVFGQAFGLWPTLLGVLVTALIGSVIIRAQGISLFEEIRATTARGTLPAKQLAEAIMIAIAGAFLLTPGYFTDLCGFLLLVPQIRTFIYEELKSRITVVGQSSFHDGANDGGNNDSSNDEDIIDLEKKDWRD